MRSEYVKVISGVRVLTSKGSKFFGSDIFFYSFSSQLLVRHKAFTEMLYVKHGHTHCDVIHWLPTEQLPPAVY